MPTWLTVEVRDVLASLAGVYDGAEPVDEREHALQIAALAVQDGSDDGFVVACLLHDVARSPLVPDDDPAHERVAARWLRPRFGDRVAWLAGAHVAAKQYLVATDPHYELSAQSRISLGAQSVSPVDPAMVADPRWPDALRLRRFDDRAKVPGAAAATVEEMLELVDRLSR